MTWNRPSIDAEARSAERHARIGAQRPAKTLHTATMGGSVAAVKAKVAPKIEHKKRQSIRDSARGEECTVRIIGVCNSDPKTTVWSHCPLNAAGHGGATKSLDLIGCYCCSACHDVVDGRAPRPAGMTQDEVMLDWFKGMCRSLVMLAAKGLV